MLVYVSRELGICRVGVVYVSMCIVMYVAPTRSDVLLDLLVFLTRSLSSSGHQSNTHTYMVMQIIDLLMEWWPYTPEAEELILMAKATFYTLFFCLKAFCSPRIKFKIFKIK